MARNIGRGDVSIHNSTFHRRIHFVKTLQLVVYFANYFRSILTANFTTFIKKTNTKIVFVLLLFVFLAFFVNGCAFKDINKRAFVTSIGIDQSEASGKKFKVTLKISLPQGEPSSAGADFTLISFNANSISEALSRMKSMTDKELFYGHTKTILIGEKVAKGDIRPLLDYFFRNPVMHKTAYLAVASPTAFQVLQDKPKVEKVAGSYLFSLFEESSIDSPYVKGITLFDAYRRETESGLNIAMPVIEVKSKKIIVDSIALFNKMRMKSKLNPEESELYRLLTSGIENGRINIKTRDGRFSIDILKGKSRFKIHKRGNNRLSANFLINLNASVEEKLDNQINLTEVQIKRLQEGTEERIKKEVIVLLDKIQNTNLDPIGLGFKYNTRNFDHKNWDNFYPNLEFKVDVACKINGAGIVE